MKRLSIQTVIKELIFFKSHAKVYGVVTTFNTQDSGVIARNVIKNSFNFTI